MRCLDARRLLVEAEPEELEGRGKGALARHLRGCPRCREDAARIRSAEAGLARVLSELSEEDRGGRRERGRSRTPGTKQGGRGVPREPGRSRKVAVRESRRWRLVAAVALAAAAAFLVARAAPERLAIDAPGNEAGRTASAPAGLEPVGEEEVRVQVPEGGNVAVLETGDPDVTVIWYY